MPSPPSKTTSPPSSSPRPPTANPSLPTSKYYPNHTDTNKSAPSILSSTDSHREDEACQWCSRVSHPAQSTWIWHFRNSYLHGRTLLLGTLNRPPTRTVALPNKTGRLYGWQQYWRYLVECWEEDWIHRVFHGLIMIIYIGSLPQLTPPKNHHIQTNTKHHRMFV